ncbi:hypothetical protein M404DRAFT_997009 [Pisolithus tinctorius Marx 270]|uniref:Uncharacterized protein n=1 Tax=Pisolithus tinctorius Marx 270 TaxID=870435 RepID=A0A0C3JI90_PISTI|nr:hypothetical protein M404DRAFT_997009 [Pisolithus tinctorius Marx 270]
MGFDGATPPRAYARMMFHPSLYQSITKIFHRMRRFEVSGWNGVTYSTSHTRSESQARKQKKCYESTYCISYVFRPFALISPFL